jgi:hypothetical protein
MEGVGEQNKLHGLDSKGSSSNVKVEAGNESKSKKVKTVDKDVKVLEGVMVKTHKEVGAAKKDWSELKVPALKDVPRVRNLKLSGQKANLVLCLIASDLEIHELENRISARPTFQLTSLELLELQKLDKHLHEIDECISNLKEYGGHLARHVSEDSYAQSKINDLADDVAIVNLDYKMKILSCFYREMQNKWFGKGGTNLLGFMITTNSLDEADKLQGVKDVQFVFMVIDDSLTDAWEVTCAKATVYEEFMMGVGGRRGFTMKLLAKLVRFLKAVIYLSQAKKENGNTRSFSLP